MPGMTILTAGACGFVATTSGGIIPAAVGTAAGVIVTGLRIWVQSDHANVAIGAALGTGLSSGAISGAIASKTIAGSASGALIGGCSSAGVGSVFAGSMAAAGGAIASNPIGLLTVGAKYEENEVTFDCWKPVVHDISKELSTGIKLKDLVLHPNIKHVYMDNEYDLPKIELENVWNEKFEIEYAILDGGDKMYCHAAPIL